VDAAVDSVDEEADSAGAAQGSVDEEADSAGAAALSAVAGGSAKAALAAPRI
jgi:hypothetical protein